MNRGVHRRTTWCRHAWETKTDAGGGQFFHPENMQLQKFTQSYSRKQCCCFVCKIIMQLILTTEQVGWLLFSLLVKKLILLLQLTVNFTHVYHQNITVDNLIIFIIF